MNLNIFFLLRFLLLHPDRCPSTPLLPQTETQWHYLKDALLRNRMIIYLYHFLHCRTCRRTMSGVTKNCLNREYHSSIAVYLRYLTMKKRIKSYLRKHPMIIVELKDITSEDLRKYYPDFFYPMKFDIDLWGRESDVKSVDKMLQSMGYTGYRVRKGYVYLDQYEYLDSDKKRFPKPGEAINKLGVEFRYQIISADVFKKVTFLSAPDRQKLNQEIWDKVIHSSDGFGRLNASQILLERILIFFFDDNCQGLKNLFDIWLLVTYKKIDWEYIYILADKYKLENVISFIISLAIKTFDRKNTNIPLDIQNPSSSVRLALRIFYLYNSLYSPLYSHESINNKPYSKDSYLFFLISGFLWSTDLPRKVLFFAHLKRLLYLSYYLLRSLSQKRASHDTRTEF